MRRVAAGKVERAATAGTRGAAVAQGWRSGQEGSAAGPCWKTSLCRGIGYLDKILLVTCSFFERFEREVGKLIKAIRESGL